MAVNAHVCKLWSKLCTKLVEIVNKEPPPVSPGQAPDSRQKLQNILHIIYRTLEYPKPKRQTRKTVLQFKPDITPSSPHLKNQKKEKTTKKTATSPSATSPTAVREKGNEETKEVKAAAVAHDENGKTVMGAFAKTHNEKDHKTPEKDNPIPLIVTV